MTTPSGRYGRFEPVRSSLGHVVHVWTARVKIHQVYLDCSVYLYPTELAAKDGAPAGGSGFLVSVPSGEHPKQAHIFAVTNKHVVLGAEGIARPSPILRFNTTDRKADTLNLAGKWITATEDDLAISLIDSASLEHCQYDPVPVSQFVTQDETWANQNIYPGTPCFMVGRFINRDGEQHNTPAVRFGDLSIMPWDKLDTEFGKQEAFIVEMHSIGGFSGSPVFTYPHFATPGSRGLTQLLGVDCGHLRVKERLMKNNRAEDDYYVLANSGGAIVIAAWRLRELLDGEDATEARMAADKKIGYRHESVGLDSMDDDPPKGPKPERLKIKGPMDKAVKKMFKKGKPPKKP